MNVSEITTDDLIVIARSGHSASFEMISALAQAELDRRGKVDEPAGKAEVVKYYNHAMLGTCYVKTVNGLIVESHGSDPMSSTTIGGRLVCAACLDSEITAAEYEAAKKPTIKDPTHGLPAPCEAPAKPPPTPCPVCKNVHENWCEEKRPEIEPLPRVAQLEDVRDKINECIKAVNAMASRLEAVERRGK
jgi:hypothetical protein